MSKPYYEKSNIINFKSNILYGDLIAMDKDQIDQWVDDLRDEVIREWDRTDKSTPPTIGKDTEDLRNAFSQLRTYDISDFFCEEDPDPESIGIIANFSKGSGAANQFFPTMLKTKISDSVNSDTGKAIYDYFAQDDLKKKFKHIMLRALVQDSMCNYTKSLKKTDNPEIAWTGENVKDFLRHWKKDLKKEFGVFVRPYTDKDLDSIVKKYKDQDYIVLLAKDVKELYEEGYLDDAALKFCGGIDGLKHYTHSARKPIERKTKETETEWNERQEKDELDRRIHYMFLLRYYRRHFRIFPRALQTFRLSLGQPVVNFPALTARWLYEHYTKHIEGTVTVYDPSAGWGGRILGAMACSRPLHYVGTDPNTDNHTVTAEIDGTEKTQSRYEWLAEFYNKQCLPLADKTPKKIGKFFKADKLEKKYEPNSYHVFDVGSEHIGDHPDFQQYKGKLDFVFTSPPYFNREQYSQDETQSFVAYKSYMSWRDGFLIPTLDNAYKSLKNDRYLVWNIANIQVGKRKEFPTGWIPLEDDSKDYLLKMGAEYKGKLKMLMSAMIGVDQENLENSVKYDGKAMKYEPMMVFYKP
jgi:hypothetical protein